MSVADKNILTLDIDISSNVPFRKKRSINILLLQ